MRACLACVFSSDRVCDARARGSLMLNSGKILLAIMDEQYKYYYTIFLVMAFKNIFVCLLSVRAAAPPLLIFRIFIILFIFSNIRHIFLLFWWWTTKAIACCFFISRKNGFAIKILHTYIIIHAERVMLLFCIGI